MGIINLSAKNKIEAVSAQDLFDKILSDYTKNQYDAINEARPKGNYTDEELESREAAFMEEAEKYARDIYSYDVSEEGKAAGLTADKEVLEPAMKLFKDYIFGYGVLTDIINDPDVSDIRLLAHDNIRVKKLGKRGDSGFKFKNPADYDAFVQYVATRNNVNVSNLNAIQRFTDAKTNRDYILRFTLSMPLVNKCEWPILSIRKVPKDFLTLDQLVELGMLDSKLANLLKSRFITGSTIICGGNSSGKTTLLNALKEEIPEDMAVLVAQQADELTTKSHPDMTFMHSLPGSGESEALYDLKNISIAGLTMDIDFFIIGEIKGDEAMYFLNAAYTGQYCAATVHAPNAPKAINKIIDYAMAGSRYTKTELLKMMDCFQTVIFMKDFKVDQVYAINGYDSTREDMITTPIYENGTFVDEQWGGHNDSMDYAADVSDYAVNTGDVADYAVNTGNVTDYAVNSSGLGAANNSTQWE